MVNVVVDGTPQSFAEAMASEHAVQWRQAAEEEMKNQADHKTWKLVPREPGMKTLGSRWVWTLKLNADGTIARWKARLVCKGFAQRPGLHFNYVYAPVAQAKSLRLLVSLANQRGLTLWQIDVRAAFLNAELEEVIFVEQAEGFRDPLHPDWVYCLLRPLYGLRQAPRCWFQRVSAVIASIGFHEAQMDTCVFHTDGDRSLGMHVDDMILAGRDDEDTAADGVIVQLKQHFDITYVRGSPWMLNIRLTRDWVHGVIKLDQQLQIEHFLQQFGMSECKAARTPASTGRVLVTEVIETPDEKKLVTEFKYRAQIGALMYLATHTRLDIAEAVSALSSYAAHPRKIHVQGVQHIWRYLQGSKDLGLTYTKNGGPVHLTAYADASYAGDVSTRRSRGAYITLVGGGPIQWWTQLMKTIALSTCEAETMAATECGKEVLWCRNLLEELGYPQVEATPVFEDNQGAIDLSVSDRHHKRTKHIHVRYRWLKQVTEQGELALVKTPTTEQLADLLTKALPPAQFLYLRAKLMGE